MAMIECFVPGEPRTFSTRGEQEWKELLAAEVPRSSLHGRERGMLMAFSLTSELRNGKPLDLDNLAEPVFSVVINRLKWFDGRRPNLRRWAASKEVGQPVGCRIRLDDADTITLPATEPQIAEVYEGDLPTSARTRGPADWAESLVSTTGLRSKVSGPCVLYLGFGYSRLNLGDIATGPIKSFIDCLYPLFGGSPGKPDDHRIVGLFVERIADSAFEQRVRVKLWPASERTSLGQ